MRPPPSRLECLLKVSVVDDIDLLLSAHLVFSGHKLDDVKDKVEAVEVEVDEVEVEVEEVEDKVEEVEDKFDEVEDVVVREVEVDDAKDVVV